MATTGQGLRTAGPVDGVLSKLIEAADEASTCWACNLQGTNKLVRIEDRAPVDYVERIKTAVAQTWGTHGTLDSIKEFE